MIKQLLLRPKLLTTVVDVLCSIHVAHPLRVAIDGIDASGKTTLADELADGIQQRNRPPLRASIDGFHHPRAKRYRRGSLSPEGYYDDAFDYDAFIDTLLMPLGPTGQRWYRTQAFDYRTDSPVMTSPQYAAQNAILFVDGVFLLRPELRPYWDVTIFLDVSFETALARALIQDRELFGTEEVVRERYTTRYIPAQQHYLEHARPYDYADFVIDTMHPDQPLLSRHADKQWYIDS